jgi:hypothetical protein
MPLDGGIGNLTMRSELYRIFMPIVHKIKKKKRPKVYRKRFIFGSFIELDPETTWNFSKRPREAP